MAGGLQCGLRLTPLQLPRLCLSLPRLCLCQTFFHAILRLPQGPRMVRDVFRLAKENAPAIIFIDEVDAIATARFDAQTGADRCGADATCAFPAWQHMKAAVPSHACHVSSGSEALRPVWHASCSSDVRIARLCILLSPYFAHPDHRCWQGSMGQSTPCCIGNLGHKLEVISLSSLIRSLTCLHARRRCSVSWSSLIRSLT